MKDGRKMRYQFYELFDAGNVDEEGQVIDPNSPKAQYQKVGRSVFASEIDANKSRATVYSMWTPASTHDGHHSHCCALSSSHRQVSGGTQTSPTRELPSTNYQMSL